jgi:UrcA family protein
MEGMMFAMMLIAGAMGLAGPVHETINVEAPRQATFRVGDLDMSRPADVRRFHRRLDIAVEQVCGSYANAVEITDQEDVTRCRTSANISAATQMAARPAPSIIAVALGR